MAGDTIVNGRRHRATAAPDTPRNELRLNRRKFGCGLAECPVAAAVANAIFDTTHVRLRTVPFTRERVRAALATGASRRP